MSTDLEGHANRAAAAFLAESGIVGANDREYHQIVALVARAWIDGYGVGSGVIVRDKPFQVQA